MPPRALAVVGALALLLSEAAALRAAAPTLLRGAPPARSARPRAPQAALLLDGAVSDLPIALYELQLSAEQLVAQNLRELTPASLVALYGAGLLTSLTPCSLSMLPLTFAFFTSLGGADDDGTTSVSERVGSGIGSGGTAVSGELASAAAAEPASVGGAATAVAARNDGAAPTMTSAVPALAFTAGLACALAALGVAAAALGRVYGDLSGGSTELLRGAVSALVLAMGLNLLRIVPLQLGLSSLLVDPAAFGKSFPLPVRAFVFGASSALLASPCASPVLATILGYVATLGDPLLGGALLVAYTLGYTSPVLLTSVLASSARDTAGQLEGRFGWVQPTSGALLVGYGTYNLLIAAAGPV